jgi:hypothetical protein
LRRDSPAPRSSSCCCGEHAAFEQRGIWTPRAGERPRSPQGQRCQRDVCTNTDRHAPRGPLGARAASQTRPFAARH